MAGRELTRQSSFDKMMSLVAAAASSSDVDRNKAAYEVQIWWMKIRKILQTINDVRAAAQDVVLISEKLSAVRNNKEDFHSVRKILSDPTFVSSVNSFLSSLPLDPSLKAKNSTARSSQTIGSALFIHYFPDEVLLDDEAIDESREADECSVAAEMLVRNLNKFIANCAKLASAAESKKTVAFRQSMLGYRFSVRYFIEKLDQWKELDASRLLQSLESPYLESYAIFFTLSKVVKKTGAEENMNNSESPTSSSNISKVLVAVKGNDEVDTNLMVYRAAEQQCAKIKQAMIKILGARAQTKIEELNAQVEATLSEDVITALETVVEDEESSGIRHIENTDAGTMASALVDPAVSAAAVPKGFQDIALILRRIAAAGGFGAPPVGSNSAANGAINLTNDEFYIGNEHHELLHEVCLDPTHRLPEMPSPGDIELQFYSQYYLPSPPNHDIQTGGWTHMIQSMSYPRSPHTMSITLPQIGAEGEVNPMQSNMTKLTNKIKSSMLFMMDDNIVCSLARSPVTEQALKQIETGAILPIIYNAGESVMMLSAKVIAVHREALLDVDSGMDMGAVLSIDVEYLCDNTVERSVLLGRVKMNSDAPTPTPFLLALQDMLNRVAGLTPNRTDLHAELSASVDFSLWMQMLSYGAMTPRDVSAIFAHVFSYLSKLQAPVRSEPFTAWTSEYLRLISSCSAFEAAIPLLPLMFEFSGACIDEIRRDIANYHVTTLAPHMKAPLGPAYISHCIMQALLSPTGTITSRSGSSLDNTMSLLVSLLSTTQKQQEVVAELLEATGQAMNLRELDRYTATTPVDSATATVAVAVTSSTSSSPHVPVSTAVVALSMLRLLQLPLRLTTPTAKAQVLPETFLFDGQRLSLFRDLVDIISVQCTVMITIRQALQKIGLLSSEVEETLLYGRLNVLLRDASVGMKSIVAEALRFVRTSRDNARGRVSSLLGTDAARSTSPVAIRYLSQGAGTGAGTETEGKGTPPRSPVSPSRANKSPFTDPSWPTPEWEEVLEKSLKNVLADGNPVLQLFTKRIYKVLLRALLGQPYLAKLPSFSLQAKGIQRNLTELISRAVKLFNLHCGVYEETYSLIFSSHTFQHYVFPEAETDVD